MSKSYIDIIKPAGTLTVLGAIASTGNSSITGNSTIVGNETISGNFQANYITSTTNISAVTANLSGDLKLLTAGKKIFLTTGTNACAGTATLVAGAVTVSTTAVTASSLIFLEVQSLAGVSLPTAVAITARTAGVSFTITSASALDTSSIAWVIIEVL